MDPSAKIVGPTVREDRSSILELIDRVNDEPAASRAAGLDLLSRSVSDEIRCLAERVVGLAERCLGNLPAACEHLRRSVEIGRAAGDDDRLVGDSLACLATALAMGGDFVGALSITAEAIALAPVAAKTQLLLHRALILQRLDRSSEALACYADAASSVSSLTKPETIVAMYNNRGMLYAASSDFVAAEGDLRSALSALRHSHLNTDDSVLLHNLGVVLSRQGRLLDAFALFAEVDHKVAATRANNVAMMVDRAELYLQARLLPEAEGAALRALDFAAVDGPAALPEVLLLLTRVRCAAGRLDEARNIAAQGRDAFRIQGRDASAQDADQLLGLLESPIRYVAPRDPDKENPLPHDAASDVSPTWTNSAFIEVALSRAGTDSPVLGRRDRERLLNLGALGTTSTNSITVIQGWCAAAMLALHRHDLSGTRFALNETIEHLTVHLATISAVELRVLALDSIAPLEALIVALVAESGDTQDFVHWTEMARRSIGSAGLTESPPIPTEGTKADMASVSAELRSVTDELKSLRPVGSEIADLLRRRSTLEWQLRMTSWLSPTAQISPRRVAARRTDEIESPVHLVFAASKRRLTCVVRGDGQDRLVQLAPLSAADSELRALRFAYSSLLSDPNESANYAALERAALRLQRVVLPPLSDSHRPVVVVPTGVLAAVPWSLLPALRKREVSLSLSLADSLTTNAIDSLSRALIVAGPGLVHAHAEIESIAALYDNPIVLAGANASSAQLSRALNEVDVLHVAAHGSPRSDNVFLSAIQLADGPFSSYDLQRVGRTPQTVILSCCDLGAVASNTSWTMLGIGSTLRDHGTAEVVMSVLPVSDESSLKFMTSVHRNLLAGASARTGLLNTTAATSDPLVRTTGQSFLTMGTPPLLT
jgi:tetratricopeptide (TPR) repeat protein